MGSIISKETIMKILTEKNHSSVRDQLGVVGCSNAIKTS